MYIRRSISGVLIVLGFFSLWLLYWDPLYVAIRAQYPIVVWSTIILFPLPLLAVGMLMWHQPYRLGKGRARPYYLYTTFCIIISCLQIMTIGGIGSHSPGAPAVPVVNSGDWRIMTEQLVAVVFGAVIFCVPLWLGFVLLWPTKRQLKAAQEKQ